MKRSTIAVSFFLSFLAASAQNITIAHLRSKLESETSDTARCKTLDSLSMYNMFFNNRSDSTFNYCNEYVNTAFQIPDKKYLILAYARLSFYYNNIGQYKESLNMALKGLDLAEQYQIQDYLSALYYDLSWFYLNSDDFKEGLVSALKGIAFLKFNKDPFFDQALHLYGMCGNLYLDINKTDSALFYYARMDSIAATSTELGEKISGTGVGRYIICTLKKIIKKRIRYVLKQLRNAANMETSYSIFFTFFHQPLILTRAK